MTIEFEREIADTVPHEGVEIDVGSSVWDWYKKCLSQCIEESDRPYTRNLIMRPTDMEHGLYETDEGPFMVAEHEGRNYLMIWCDDEDNVESEPGDLVYLGVYSKSYASGFEESVGVDVTEMKAGGL